MASSQAQQVADRLPQSLPSYDPEAPTVIIPSALQLTRKQEKDLLALAARRLKELEEELGRFDYSEANWVSKALSVSRTGRGVPFMAKRHLAHLIYHLQTDWRAEMLGGIWKETNLHLPLVRRNVMQQIAKAQAYFFGTTPWFGVYALPWKETAFATKVNHWARHEATASGLDSTLTKAIDLAFIQGEQVTKTIYERNVSYYKTFAEVLVGPDNKPVIASDGDFIFRKDLFVPVPDPVPSPGMPLPGAIPTAPPAPRMVLKRDMKTPMPPGQARYVRTLIQRRLLHFTGARTRNVHYMDFLCPLTARDLQSADCLIHLYSEPVINMVNRLLVDDWNSTGLSAKEQLARIKELTQQLLPGANNDQNRPAADRPRPELNESTDMQGRDRVEPEASLAEVWIKADVDGDGIVENVMLLMDREGRVPIYYDYVANVTHDGLRPFVAHPINRVENRWHGQGQVETMYPLQHSIDLLVNRWNFAQMSSARVDFWKPSNTEEGDKDPNLRLNWGRAYTLKPDKTAAETLTSVYLREIKGNDLKSLLELLIQMMTNMGGTANVNDSRMAGLETTDLATGVKNLEQSQNELFGKYVAELTPSMAEATKQFLGLTLAHVTESAPRIYRFLETTPETQDMIQRVANFTAEDARDISLDVMLELSRYRSAQESAQGEAAWKIATEYYGQPAEVQDRLTSLARQRLKTLEVRNGDQIISPLLLPSPVGPDGTPLPNFAGTPSPTSPSASPAPPPVPAPAPPPVPEAELSAV